jgi:peptide/nickel transport system substrate-binding protein
MKKIRLLTVLLLAFSLVLSACSKPASEEKGSDTGAKNTPAATADNGSDAVAPAETTITIGQVSEVANLNPMLYPRTPDSNVQCLIFDTLVAPDENLEFKGDLAESWDISEDGKLYTFYLREGVKWHDGQDFTADDVVFTFTSLASPNYVGGAESRVSSIVGVPEYTAGTAQTVSGIKKVNDYTVSFELTEPNAAFLGQLYTSVLPEHILAGIDPGEWDKADFNRAPIGTGKYEFVKWESGQYIELVKNPDYFGTPVQIDHIIYRFGDATTLTAALINGEIDVVEAIQTSEVELLEANAGTSAYVYPTLNMYYVGLNLQNKALSDIRVRQALSYALDKPTIVSTVYGEYAIPTNDIFPENHWSHSTNVTTYDYDPAKAESLLQEAGFTKNSKGIYEKDGKELHFVFDMVTKGQEQADMAQMLQQYWGAVGVSVEIREQDFSTLAFTRLLPSDASGVPRAVAADDFDMYTLGFGVEVDPDEYRSYFESSFFPPNGMNFINYSNPAIDTLFAQSTQLTDPEERADCYHQIADLISQDIPWIPLYDMSSIVGVSSKVQNYVADFRGITYQIEKWSIAQ